MKKMVVPNEILLEQAHDLLSRGIEVVLMTKGNSMLPFIHSDRDSVTLERVGGPLSVGDIVLFRYKGKYIMHRIYAIGKDGITLMGDGNLNVMEHCTASDVIGIVTGLTKGNGRRIKPGKARVWRTLKPLRRWLLAIYRRI